MIPFIVDTTNPHQSGLLDSFASPGAGIDPDFVFRDIQLAYYHRPVVPNGQGLWQDDWLDTDTFQVTIGDRDAQPTSGTFPIGVFVAAITLNSIANPTVVTTAGSHNLTTGDKVLITGSNSTPIIDGLYTVTVTDGTHFTIPVNVTGVGGAGSIYDATGLSALPYNESAAAFATALNTILTKHSYPTVAGASLSAGQYNFVGATNGVIPSFYSPTSNSLIPQSGVGITIVANGDASSLAQQIVTLYQAPVAYSEPSTPLPIAALAVSETQAGSSTQNAIFVITLTAGTYGGTFSCKVTLANGTTMVGIIANGGVSASDFQTALVNAAGLANTDFNVTRINDVLNVEFAGTLGNNADVNLVAANIDLLAPLGVSGFINLNTFALFEAFAATTEDELSYYLSIRRTRDSGEQAEYFLVPVTLKRNLVQGVALIPVPMPSYYTAAQSDARYVQSVLTGKTLWVDAVNGNDTSGTSGRQDKPFLTLGAAKAAASSGDLIYVRPGSYTVNNGTSLMKDGVNWNFDLGVNVDKSLTTGEVGIFDDEGSAMSCNVTGEGVFLLTSVTSGEFAYVGCVHTINAGTNLTIHAQSIGAIQGTGVSNTPMGVNAVNGTVRVTCSKSIFGIDNGGITNCGIALYWEHGLLIAEAPEIFASHNPVNPQSDGTDVENMYVTANEIYSMGSTSPGNGPGVILATSFGTNPNAACWVTSDIIRGNIGSDYTSIASLIDGSNKIYVQTQKLFGQLKIDGGLTYVTSTKIEALGNVSGVITALFVKTTVGTLRYNVGQHDPKSFTGLGFVITGGTVLANQIEYTSGSGSDGLSISGGTARLTACILNTAANNAGNPALKSGGVLILIGSTLVAEGSRDSISAPTSQNVVAMSSWANKAIDGDVTIATTGGLTVDSDVA